MTTKATGIDVYDYSYLKPDITERGLNDRYGLSCSPGCVSELDIQVPNFEVVIRLNSDDENLPNVDEWIHNS